MRLESNETGLVLMIALGFFVCRRLQYLIGLI
jgi:hypothetical protein